MCHLPLKSIKKKNSELKIEFNHKFKVKNYIQWKKKKPKNLVFVNGIVVQGVRIIGVSVTSVLLWANRA